MSTFYAPKYPPPIAHLLGSPATTPGSSADVQTALERFDFSTAVAPQVVVDADMARSCESGLWLRHHCLDRSHKISQQIETPTGSYWHGIMHRCEGDFGNAKYWFRRVGVHPIFSQLATAAQAIDADRFQDAKVWDPYDFVDHCEAASNQKKKDTVLHEVANVEWDLLFGFCFRQAIGID